jgi:hypothetical protein
MLLSYFGQTIMIGIFCVFATFADMNFPFNLTLRPQSPCLKAETLKLIGILKKLYTSVVLLMYYIVIKKMVDKLEKKNTKMFHVEILRSRVCKNEVL